MDSQDLLGTEMLPLTPPTSDEKTLAMLAHLLTFIAPILAPLIIYIIKKNESPFVAAHALESLNFQITLIILFIISFILMILIIGIFMLSVLGIAGTILIIIASVRANEGKLYKYPFCIRIIN